MMCDCMHDKKKLIMETAASKINSLNNWVIEEAEFKHTTEIFLSPLNIPIVIKGTNSKGKEAKKELYYPAVYCPFCGEKLIED
jgi:hypothetical protein